MAIRGFLFLTISQQTPDQIILGRLDRVGALFLKPFRALHDRASFVFPTSRAGVGRTEAPPVGPLRRSQVVLGCSSCSGTARLPRRLRRPRRAPVFLRPQN